MLTSLVQYCQSSHLDLFSKKDQNFSIAYKDSSSEDGLQIARVFEQVGLLNNIVCVQQPLHSAEINSQNFLVTLSSGDKLLLRRCSKFQGQERYASIYNMIKLLRAEGVHTPEFETIFSESSVPYFEIGKETLEKTCWVFFKYIEAKNCFSGTKNELQDAAEQIGKMHFCFKKHYHETLAIPANATQVDSRSGPSMTKDEWNEYLDLIESIITKDSYDNLFLDNRVLIEDAVIFVMNNFNILEGSNEMQNIHFDLNCSNFLIDDQGLVRIMDYDTVQYGNVYTDVGFAFHRLLTTCLEGGATDISDLALSFVSAYKKGNPNLDFDPNKLIVATYNRALRNIRSNLSLKMKNGLAP